MSNNLQYLKCCHVRKFVTFFIIFGAIYLYYSAQNYIDTSQEFLWVLSMLLLLQICFCFIMRYFKLSLSNNNQADVVEAFNSTSRYQDDLLNIDNPYFEQMVSQIYLTEFQINKANSSET